MCKDKALLPASPPARCSLTLLLEESQQRGEIPAHENHHGGRGRGSDPQGKGGGSAAPRGWMLSLLCPGCSHPACAGGADAGGPQLPPSLRPHPHGPEDARPGEDAPAQLFASRDQPEPGTAARWQEGTVPAAAEGKRGGPSSGLLLAPPRPSRLLPRTARTTGICSSRLGASISSTPPSWTPGTPPTRSLVGTAVLQTSCLFPQLGGTGRNWEAFPPRAMTQHRQQCHIPHPSLPPQDRAPFPAGNTRGKGCLSLGTRPRHGHKGWQHRGKTSSGTSLTSSSSCWRGGR